MFLKKCFFFSFSSFFVFFWLNFCFTCFMQTPINSQSKNKTKMWNYRISGHIPYAINNIPGKYNIYLKMRSSYCLRLPFTMLNFRLLRICVFASERVCVSLIFCSSDECFAGSVVWQHQAAQTYFCVHFFLIKFGVVAAICFVNVTTESIKWAKKAKTSTGSNLKIFAFSTLPELLMIFTFFPM